MVMKKLHETLNGKTGFVITSGMILLLIAVVTIGLAIIKEARAQNMDLVESCVEKRLTPIEQDISDIKSDGSCMKTDIAWMKDILKEIKSDIKKK